jgi:hypothetical protein
MSNAPGRKLGTEDTILADDSYSRELFGHGRKHWIRGMSGLCETLVAISNEGTCKEN